VFTALKRRCASTSIAAKVKGFWRVVIEASWAGRLALAWSAL